MTDPRCGTEKGVQAHYAAGTPPCDACRAARATAEQARRVARAARTPFWLIPHGANGYTNYNCRCPVCRKANRELAASRRRALLRLAEEYPERFQQILAEQRDGLDRG